MSACADWPLICPRASDGLRSAYGFSSAKQARQTAPASTSPTTAGLSCARSRCTRSPAAISSASSTAPAVYFVAVATPIGRAGERPVEPPAALVHEQAGDERDRDRGQRHDVVERVLGVEDRQERDRHQRRGDEPDAALVVARARPVGEPADERPDQRDEHARGEERGLGVGGELAHQAAPAPEREPGGEAQLEQPVEEIGERRRVLVVARVQPAAEHLDRLGDEVLGLVGVVGVGQAVPDVPEPQRERAEQDRAQQPRRPAPAHASSRGP